MPTIKTLTNKEKKMQRPFGCSRTITGRHIPAERIVSTAIIEFYCKACGLIDDTKEQKFAKYLGYFFKQKIDDKKLK